jgi:PAS domain S-box-containing protein
MDGVIIMSSEGVISNWNNQAASIFGWSKQEAIGMDLALLIIPQAYREAHQQGLLHYIKTGESRILNRRVEVTALRKNGELFPLELTVSPVHSENGIRYSAFVRDISQRNQARQELEFISSRLTALIRNLQAGVMVEDDKGKVVITIRLCAIYSVYL